MPSLKCSEINFVNCFLFVRATISVNELFRLPQNKLQSPLAHPRTLIWTTLKWPGAPPFSWLTHQLDAKPNMFRWSAMTVPTGNPSWSLVLGWSSLISDDDFCAFAGGSRNIKITCSNGSPKHWWYIYQSRFKSTCVDFVVFVCALAK